VIASGYSWVRGALDGVERHRPGKTLELCDLELLEPNPVVAAKDPGGAWIGKHLAPFGAAGESGGEIHHRSYRTVLETARPDGGEPARHPDPETELEAEPAPAVVEGPGLLPPLQTLRAGLSLPRSLPCASQRSRTEPPETTAASELGALPAVPANPRNRHQ